MSGSWRPPPGLVARLEAAALDRAGRKRGAEVIFSCPAHEDLHPSATFNVDKAAWYCFACGAGGGALDLARRLGLEP